MNMNKLKELQALRESASALKQTVSQVESNLAIISARIDISLDELRDNQSVETMTKLKTELDYLVDKLTDTGTIVELIIKGKQLENKLHELDNSTKVESAGPELIKLSGDLSLDGQEAHIEYFDPETLKRIEQKLELDTLVRTLYPDNAEKLKSIMSGLDRVRPMRQHHSVIPSSNFEIIHTRGTGE